MLRIVRFAVMPAFLAAFVGSAAAEETPRAPGAKAEPRLEFVYLELTGVEAAEAEGVARATSAVAGVRGFTWTAPMAEAKVVREVGKGPDSSLTAAAIAGGAATAGVVPLAATTFAFDKKLHCGGCVAGVNKALAGLKGLKESHVSPEMTTVMAVYDTRKVKPADIEAVLAAIGKAARATS